MTRREDAIYRVYGDYSEIPGRKPNVKNIVKVELLGFEQEVLELREENKNELKKILELKDGWYYGNSKSFQTNTIDKAFLYFSKINHFFKKNFEKHLMPPMIFPGPDGSIVLEWSEDSFFLQITIPEKNKTPIKIYGRDKPKGKAFKRYARTFQVNMEFLEWLNQRT